MNFVWGAGVPAGHKPAAARLSDGCHPEPPSSSCHPEPPSVGGEGPASPGGVTTSVASALQRALRLFGEILGEIFDENAYSRFLARRALAPSRAAYDEFLRENARMRERRPRCC